MYKRRHAGRIEMNLGLLLLAAAIALTAYNFWDSYRAGQSAQDILSQVELPPVLVEAVDPANWYLEPVQHQAPSAEEEIPEVTEPEPVREMPTQKINGLECIGVLEVPKYQLVLPVISDWDYDKLQLSPCVYTGSYFTRDLVICGHNYPSHFSYLKDIPLEADIYFTTVDGVVYHYLVDNVETVNPTEISHMVIGEGWDLTLFTCHTGGATRCAIRCVQIFD